MYRVLLHSIRLRSYFKMTSLPFQQLEIHVFLNIFIFLHYGIIRITMNE